MIRPSASSGLRQPMPAALWVGAAGAGLALAVPMFLSCMCGHLAQAGLPLSLLAVGLTFHAMVRHGAPNLSVRAVADAFAVLAALVLFKNLADVLWFGHAPRLPRPSEAALRLWSRALIGSASASLALLSAWALTIWVRRHGAQSLPAPKLVAPGER